ncbi:diguanylate cyclase with GAF sensor [Granulicella pectinivorans]|uniref:diguanylate cyclase n=1 Tax=Granulicella pectinivorans TaxID=474950 RepID=A0A1I6LLL7_9BACT|nr:sensor domain-containing diguanylate cyclase [Granulicella pectinivorans]SFS04152.1 diguanylate cyclase with GAF sensor [Granulicella pectinivorans]
MVDTKLEDEAGRLAALHRYEVLDTPKEAAFDRITGLVKTVLSVPICAVSLIDADRQWFKSCVGLDVDGTARDISFCTHTIKARVPMNIPDAAEDPRFAENPLVTGAPYIRSYLGVPLSSPDGYNLGSLCAIDTKPRDFDPTQIEVLKSFAAIVTNEMELRRIAQVDHLTGAATRRGFTVEVDKTISRFLRGQTPAAFVVMDIDHFKKVNDTYGHPAGDIVLRTVGTKLSELIRSGDLLGRLGGEEFGILLTGDTVEQATETAERLREALETTVIEHDPPIRITASFGIAALDAECLSFEKWLAKADAALYEAKRTGRNKCCVA